ncbi:energy transducer TonB [Dyadobacter jiangsuensis]|uniref:TonB family protein n=1 Tax=Dyadobacter jiangsuensis TaxID=1591085 RepID=A0A2P8GJB1_9BACT|nr:energy transducer TonB [Dyadobacter jiangsuensis]PSL34041.1 TonB family protein [Dyadobacter jiangsuensis]
MDYFRNILPFILSIVSAFTNAQIREVPLQTHNSIPFVCELPAPGLSNNGTATRELDCLLTVEQQPEYPGGPKAMYKFMEANLHIPPAARQAGISGKVFVSFAINKTGDITNVTVLKGLGLGCDSEAVRLVKSMPKWKPGRQNDQSVSVKYMLPILFKSK